MRNSQQNSDIVNQGQVDTVAGSKSYRDEMKAEPAPELSIILATLNERDSLPRLLDDIGGQPLPSYEIVVVDDGSTDGTREFLQELSRKDGRVRPIFHEGRQSLLQAHCQGIEVARGDLAIIMDADLQHPPEILPSIIRELQKGNVLVVASRHVDGGSPGEVSFYRSLLSKGARLMARFLLPRSARISDPISGFYGFHRSVFVPVNPRWRGYELLPFLLAMCRDLPAIEIPYEFQQRRFGFSKIVNHDLGFIRIYLTQIVLVARFERLLHDRLRSGSKVRIPSGHESITGPRSRNRNVSPTDAAKSRH